MLDLLVDQTDYRCGEGHEVDLEQALELALRRNSDLGFEQLSEPEQVLVALWAVEAEVNNGGFDQFFFNSAGDFAFFVPEALRLLGAPKMAAIAERANALFGPSGPPRDWKTRQSALMALTSQNEDIFDALDREFYAYPEDLSTLAAVYIERTRTIH